MILDAMNQKQVINRYAKLDSSGFFVESEGETKGERLKMFFFNLFFFLSEETLKFGVGGGGVRGSFCWQKPNETLPWSFQVTELLKGKGLHIQARLCS